MNPKPARIYLTCACGGVAEGQITAGEPERRFRAIWESVHGRPECAVSDRARSGKQDFSAALAAEGRPA